MAFRKSEGHIEASNSLAEKVQFSPPSAPFFGNSLRMINRAETLIIMREIGSKAFDIKLSLSTKAIEVMLSEKRSEIGIVAKSALADPSKSDL